MSDSKVHLVFADRLTRDFPNVYTPNEALIFPAHFLGPNYETVLNYWKFLDKFSPEDFVKRFRSPGARYNEAIRILAQEISQFQATAWHSTWEAHNIELGFSWVTVELIAMHKILEEGKSLVYVPQLFNE
jgi:hypothetical protein